jgi:tryptophan 2,3-dioxygenase
MTATPAGITYADYLKLDQLLSAQQPLSSLHDEMLFIIIHQTKELWMKEMLHELRLAITLVQRDRFAEAYKAMARISRIQAVMTLSWDVLSTLTPVDYLKFRDVLGTSSGFQSQQFRELEFRLGLKEPSFVDHYQPGSRERAALEQALIEPSLREAAHEALERAGFDLGDRSVEAVARAWLEVYRDAERWFDLYELAEKLVDIDDALAGWRHKHVLTVERIIGNKQGTGGSAGAPYLRSTIDKRVYPELWALRTDL